MSQPVPPFRRFFRLSTARILSQCVFIFLFFFTCWATWTSRIGGYPISRLLEIDPLVLFSTFLSTGYVYRFLGWALGLVCITMIFGRVFCNWMCPYGTLHQFTNWVFSLFRARDRIAANRYRPLYLFKYSLLTALLVLSFFGALQIGLLDPLCLLYRSVVTAFAPAWDMLIAELQYLLTPLPVSLTWMDALKTAPHVEDRLFQGSFWIGIILYLFIAANLFIPRFFCRVLCPLGALLGTLSRTALFRINREVNKCTDCNLCLTRCEGAADPQGALRLSECFTCMNCIDDCPEDALSYTALKLDTKQVIPSTGLGRRRLIFSAFTGTLLYPLLKSNGPKADKNFSPDLIRPPGSVAEDEFLQRCIKCDQCINVCPTNVLQPATFAEGGFEALWTPVMKFTVGHCQLKCSLCSEVCPTGAIRTITVSEKLGKGSHATAGPVKLGTAFYDHGRCFPHAMDIPCVVCEEVCPVSPKAIQTKDEEIIDISGALITLQKPYIIPELCIGCGICEQECPVKDEPAVYVTAIGESRSNKRSLILHDRFKKKKTKQIPSKTN